MAKMDPINDISRNVGLYKNVSTTLNEDFLHICHFNLFHFCSEPEGHRLRLVHLVSYVISKDTIDLVFTLNDTQHFEVVPVLAPLKYDLVRLNNIVSQHPVALC
jgi:hypothetical protein